MKTSFIVLLLLAFMDSSAQNKPVEKLDKERFMGKWYSLASIPTFLDKNWRETVENYSLSPKGHIDVYTTYTKRKDGKAHAIGSKLFPVEGAAAGEMKAQFIWPIKAGYRVIELADDYSYTVIGHPDKKFLFIMSRKPTMDKSLYSQIVSRCKAAGYDTDKLVSQEHKAL